MPERQPKIGDPAFILCYGEKYIGTLAGPIGWPYVGAAPFVDRLVYTTVKIGSETVRVEVDEVSDNSTGNQLWFDGPITWDDTEGAWTGPHDW